MDSQKHQLLKYKSVIKKCHHIMCFVSHVSLHLMKGFVSLTLNVHIWITCYIFNVVNLVMLLKIYLHDDWKDYASYIVRCGTHGESNLKLRMMFQEKLQLTETIICWFLSNAYTMNNKNWANLFWFYMIVIMS